MSKVQAILKQTKEVQEQVITRIIIFAFKQERTQKNTKFDILYQMLVGTTSI
jgi:hypothetical protein